MYSFAKIQKSCVKASKNCSISEKIDIEKMYRKTLTIKALKRKLSKFYKVRQYDLQLLIICIESNNQITIDLHNYVTNSYVIIKPSKSVFIYSFKVSSIKELLQKIQKHNLL